MPLKFYNTLGRKKEIFTPIQDKKVGLYTCGPTVYWYAHIGNLRAYVFEDVLKRVLKYNGYDVTHVMNITDVGHLVSNADTGEDKMEIGAQREQKTAWEIADFYTKAFKEDLKKLNIEFPTCWTKATDYIKEQIELIKLLEDRGYTYQIADGIYFDTSKIKDYGKLAGLKKQKLQAGARVVMMAGKKNITDFALWKFSPAGIKRQMEWDSPWGKGFPGWHTECVAMAVKHLGIPFDLHCGGIDHISVHHTNEIAQAEAAFSKLLANFWLHCEFLTLKEGRMGKSEGNIIRIEDLVKKGFNPLAYRYLCLGTHYRSKLTFSWDALQASQNALDHLCEKVAELKQENSASTHKQSKKTFDSYKNQFLAYLNDDLNMPRALALAWDMIGEGNLSAKEKYNLLALFDKIFALGFEKIKPSRIPQHIKKMARERQQCRKEKNWQKADDLRKEIESFGYHIEDTPKGTLLKKI